MMVNESDFESLVERCKSGDNRTQFTLYERYAEPMYNVSLRIVGNRRDAEDVLQIAFIQAFENIGKLKDNELFGPWLKRIVVNQSIDALRKNNPADLVSLDDEHQVMNLLPPQEILKTEEESYSNQMIDEIKVAMSRLADGYRTILSLYLLEGYDHSEIANILDISESTSRTQYMRARNRLREIVREQINSKG